MDDIKTHGGARENAGRKSEGKVKRSFTLLPRTLEILKEENNASDFIDKAVVYYKYSGIPGQYGRPKKQNK